LFIPNIKSPLNLREDFIISWVMIFLCHKIIMINHPAVHKSMLLH